jgi:hypothetical protein
MYVQRVTVRTPGRSKLPAVSNTATMSSAIIDPGQPAIVLHIAVSFT